MKSNVSLGLRGYLGIPVFLFCLIPSAGFSLDIATTQLVQGIQLNPYSQQLEATNGAPPYTWQVSSGYAEQSAPNSFSAVGVGQGWSGFGAFYTYDLPFTFPFYGETFTQCIVQTDGSIFFEHGGEYIGAHADWFDVYPMIAVHWFSTYELDCYFGGTCDVYIDEHATGVTIRWSAELVGPWAKAEFSVTLTPEGSVHMKYGDGANGAGLIGVAAGHTNGFALSAFCSNAMANADDVVFLPPAGGSLPPGMDVSGDGLVSGRPKTWGTNLVGVLVTDSNGVMASTALELVIDPLLPLEIVDGSLPMGTKNEAYDVQLTAANGAPPYVWEIPGTWSEAISSNTFTGAGSPVPYDVYNYGSGKSIPLEFGFPFFGRVITGLVPTMHGTILFEYDSYIRNNPEFGYFATNPMIAAFWAPQTYDGTNMPYAMESSEDHITLRWDTHYSYYAPTNTEVNASCTLYSNGVITFRYGPSNECGGVIGVSAGDGTNYLFSALSLTGSMHYASDISFQTVPDLPPGMSFTDQGRLYGTPTNYFATSMTFRVYDYLSVTGKTLDLTIASFDNTAPNVLSNMPPATGSVVVSEASSQVFRVYAEDPEGSNMVYTWTLTNGVVGGNTSSWEMITDWGDAMTGELAVTISDGDLVTGLSWSVEITWDNDGDSMSNLWENQYGLDPWDAADATNDPDLDLLVNSNEHVYGTDPFNADTDGDGMSDGYEVANGYRPLVPDTIVDNVRAGQRTNSHIVDLFYDMTSWTGAEVSVTVSVSTNGGLTYDYVPVSCAGDIGEGILAGPDLHIEWNAGEDLPGVDSSEVVIRVRAIDAAVVAAPPPGFVIIPGGEFQMGDTFAYGNPGHSDTSTPVHTVYTDPFYMSRYEVTRQQIKDVFEWAWQQDRLVVTGCTLSVPYIYEGSSGGLFPALEITSSEQQFSNFCGCSEAACSNIVATVNTTAKTIDFPYGDMDWPSDVHWHGARAFCQFKSEMEGLPSVYDVHSVTQDTWYAHRFDASIGGYRLPTEAEWEKAARGGPDGRHFPWGGQSTNPSNDINQTLAWYGTNYFNEYASVGSYGQNGYGLYDMAGNIDEFCWDHFHPAYYIQPGALEDNTQGPEIVVHGDFFPTVRGGGRLGPMEAMRCAGRYHKGSFSPRAGIRLVRSAVANSSVSVTQPLSLDTTKIIPEFSATPRMGPPPLSVTFSNLSTGPGMIRYVFDFGDGVTNAVLTPDPQIHEYTSNGQYNVTLTVEGNSSTGILVREEYVVVTDSIILTTTPAVSSFAVKPETNLLIEFSVAVSNVDESSVVVSYTNAQNGAGTVVGSISQVNERIYQFFPDSGGFPTGSLITVHLYYGGEDIGVEGDMNLPESESFTFSTFPNVYLGVVQVLDGHEDFLVAGAPTLVTVKTDPFYTESGKAEAYIEVNVQEHHLGSGTHSFKDTYTDTDYKLGRNFFTHLIGSDDPSVHTNVDSWAWIKISVENGFGSYTQMVIKPFKMAHRSGVQQFKFFPVRDPGGAKTIGLGEYLSAAQANLDYLVASTPLTRDMISFSVSPGYVTYENPRSAAAGIPYMLRLPLNTIGVGICSRNFMHDADGLASCGNTGFLITSKAIHAMAHEFMHAPFGQYCTAYGVKEALFNYEDYDKHPENGRLASDGWWALRQRRIFNVDKSRWPEWAADFEPPVGEPYPLIHNTMGIPSGTNRKGPWVWARDEDYLFLFNKCIEQGLLYYPGVGGGQGGGDPEAGNPFDFSRIHVAAFTDTNGAWVLEPIFRSGVLPDEPLLETNADAYAVFLYQGATQKVFSFTVPGLTPVESNEYGLGFSADCPAEFDELSLYETNGNLVAHLQASDNVPGITVDYPNGGETLTGNVAVTWTASDPDEGSLWYYAYLSDDDTNNWSLLFHGMQTNRFEMNAGLLAAGTNYRVAVVVSDGFHFNYDMCDAVFSVPPAPPIPFIQTPDDGGKYDDPSSIGFAALAYDPEGGELSGSNFVWRNGDGSEFNTGTYFNMTNLGYGFHTVQVEARTEDGRTGISESVTFSLLPDLYFQPDFSAAEPYNFGWYAQSGHRFYLVASTSLTDAAWTTCRMSQAEAYLDYIQGSNGYAEIKATNLPFAGEAFYRLDVLEE